MSVNATEQLVSTGHVAATCGVSRSAVKGWEARGQIKPAIRVLGSDRRVWPASDMEVLKRQIAELKRGQRRPDRPAA